MLVQRNSKAASVFCVLQAGLYRPAQRHGLSRPKRARHITSLDPSSPALVVLSNTSFNIGSLAFNTPCAFVRELSTLGSSSYSSYSGPISLSRPLPTAMSNGLGRRRRNRTIRTERGAGRIKFYSRTWEACSGMRSAAIPRPHILLRHLHLCLRR